MKLDSSTKTIWDAQPRGVFYVRPSLALPLLNLLFVALERPALWFPATDAQLMQRLRDMTAMELTLTVLLDQAATRRVIHSSVLKLLAIAPFSSSLTIFLRSLPVNAGRRPGEKRACNASSPPLSAASRHRITEFAAAPSMRPTSLSEEPSSSNRNDWRRRASISSAEPVDRGISVLALGDCDYHCIIYRRSRGAQPEGFD